MKRYLPRLLILGLLSVFALPQPCLACSCAPPRPPAEALARGDAVFRGRVVAVAQTPSNPWPFPGAYPHQRVTFEVNTSWKGPATRQVDVFTGMGGGDCG